MLSFRRYRKRDSFDSMDIEDRVCRTLEYKLNIVRHSFLSSGVPIVKREKVFDGIEETVELYMYNCRNIDIHLTLKDTNNNNFIISDLWTRIKTEDCPVVGIYGICLEVKKVLRRKICRQLASTLKYLFKRKLFRDLTSKEPADIPIIIQEFDPKKKVSKTNIGINRIDDSSAEISDTLLHLVMYYDNLAVEDRLEWFLNSDLSKERMREIIETSERLKGGSIK